MPTRSTHARPLVAAALLGLGLALPAGCASTGIAVREKLGIPKREQLVDRVDDAKDAQESAKEQFATTLEQFKALTAFDGGDLEKLYNKLKSEYDRSVSRADAVRSRISAVEKVAGSMFKEWNAELAQYTDPNLRAASERQLYDTRTRYDQLVGAMKRAEAKMDPVLSSFNNQILFLKHSLNAQAIASLGSTVTALESDIGRLIADMEASIAEANAFIAQMQPAS
jgi:hypothetical protein